jgi:hypothetical protein
MGARGMSGWALTARMRPGLRPQPRIPVAGCAWNQHRGGRPKRPVGTEGCPHGLWRHEAFLVNEEAVGRLHRRSLPIFGSEDSRKKVGDQASETENLSCPSTRMLAWDCFSVDCSCFFRACQTSAYGGLHFAEGGLWPGGISFRGDRSAT